MNILFSDLLKQFGPCGLELQYVVLVLVLPLPVAQCHVSNIQTTNANIRNVCCKLSSKVKETQVNHSHTIHTSGLALDLLLNLYRLHFLCTDHRRSSSALKFEACQLILKYISSSISNFVYYLTLHS